MALSPGDKLGPYEILAPLGAGVMGEVYRARDSKLNREVAIKVLPAALANDADDLARFQREAQALAALHHPNIATIFGLEQNSIVMELIEGHPLQGPLSIEAVLPIAKQIAKQIAEALEAAHEKGIVHRDLKPANNTSFSTRSGPGAPWQTTLYLMGPFNQSFAKFSRDGRFVAYVSDESGEYEVYVRPFPSGPGKWRVTPKGGIQPRWSRDGKEIFYLDKGVLMAVPFSVKGDTFTPGTPQVLFDTGAYNSGRTTWKYDELPDGRFVFAERGADALEASRTIHVISNWPTLLDHKTPAKE